jgi:hypothetical protein
MADYGNYGWLFQSGTDAIFTALIAIGDKTQLLSEVVRGHVHYLLFLPLFHILYGIIVDHSHLKSATGVAASTGIALFFLQPTAVEFPGRAPIEISKAADIALHRAIPVYEDIAKVYRTKNDDQSILLVKDLTEREIAPFEGSDLAKLMRDYKQYCEPNQFDDQSIPETTWQSVGLRGGGALGVPDSQLSVFSKATNDNVKDSTFKLFPQIRQVMAVIDAYQGGRRRATGIEALKDVSSDKWPSGKLYLLPNSTGWKSKIAGGVDEPAGYLDPHKVGGGLARPGLKEGTVPDRYFSPQTCYEAYVAAQAGAEEGYRAVSDKVRPSNLAPDSEQSVVAGVSAWSDVVNKSLSTLYSGKDDNSPNSVLRKAAADGIGALNEAKSAAATLDLAALLPSLVYGISLAIAGLIHGFPVFALLGCFLGLSALFYWVRLFAWALVSLLLAEGLLYLVSSLFANLAYMQAATALSNSGTPLDIAGLRGTLAGCVEAILGLATWVSGYLLRVQSPDFGSRATSFSALGGAVASIAGSALSGVMKVSSLSNASLRGQVLRHTLKNGKQSAGSAAHSPASRAPSSPISQGGPRPSAQSFSDAGKQLARPPTAKGGADPQGKHRTTRAERAARKNTDD